jgi:arabinan endo-1,5-alpha-L-arabinosidase
MASRANLIATCALPLMLCGCQGSTDIVAASYGDYDPNNPPTVLPIEAVPVTDPTLFRWQGTYWVFSTGPGISAHSSKDLITFQQEKRVFGQNPAWIGQDLPQVTDLWAPHVLAWNGKIHLYYAASTFSTDRACIGHATATSIGDFVDQGRFLICSNLTSTVDYTAIDPAVLLDVSGEPWMVFGSWGSGIKLIELDRDGNYRDTPIYSVAARSSDNPAIQAASLYRWRDYYYLFVSFDNSPNHSLRVGRATQVKGPYYDRDGKNMVDGGGTLVLASMSDSPFKGPGSNMVFDDQGQRLNVYHAYDANQKAVLRIGQLFFDDDGWPVAAGP